MANVLGTSIEYLTGETDNPLPTSYYIQESSDPELFHLIEMYETAGAESQKRLLEYCKKLSK